MVGRTVSPATARQTWSQAGLLVWCILCVGVGCLAVATILFSDHSPLLDALTPFTGHLWGVSIAGALAVLAPKWRLGTVAGCLLAILAAHSAFAYFGANIRRPGTTNVPPNFKIVLLNTWHHHADHQGLTTYLAGLDADVVALTEIGPDKLPLLDALRRSFPHQVHCAHQWRCSVALLSKHPIEAGVATRDDPNQAPIAVARLTTAAGEPAITVIATHVHRPTRDPYLHQVQMQRLAAIAGTISGPVILAGDFNAVPWSASLRRLRQATGLKVHAAMLPTWPATNIGLPQFALDHVLLSNDLEVRASSIGPAVGSDHYPVIVEVAPLRPLALPPHGPTAPHRRRNLHTATPTYLFAQVVPHLTGKHHTP